MKYRGSDFALGQLDLGRIVGWRIASSEARLWNIRLDQY